MKKKWYRGKVFVITGATGEIGSATCRLFAPLGMRMYLLDLENTPLDKLAEEMKELGAEHAEGMVMDVTNREQIENVIKTIVKKEKYIDILHNNAGFGNKTSITNEGKFEDYRKIMECNVDGVWLVLQTARPYIGRPAPTKKFPDRREGQLIITASSGGKVGIPNMAAYVMSKHALVGLADSIRLEYRMKDHKIHVITICPAPAKTKFWDSTPEFKEWITKYEKKSFLYQYVTAEKVAKNIRKASRKNIKEILVPRWWWAVVFIRTISHGFIGNFMIKIEKGKQNTPKNK